MSCEPDDDHECVNASGIIFLFCIGRAVCWVKKTTDFEYATKVVVFIHNESTRHPFVGTTLFKCGIVK